MASGYRVEGVRRWSDFVAVIARRVIRAAESAKVVASTNGRNDDMKGR